MGDWYESGLAAALDGADVFICVVSPAWDSSTWMAEEAEQALRRYRSGQLKQYFSYKSQGVLVRPGGMTRYLINALPDKVSDAVREVLEAVR